MEIFSVAFSNQKLGLKNRQISSIKPSYNYLAEIRVIFMIFIKFGYKYSINFTNLTVVYFK